MRAIVNDTGAFQGPRTMRAAIKTTPAIPASSAVAIPRSGARRRSSRIPFSITALTGAGHVALGSFRVPGLLLGAWSLLGQRLRVSTLAHVALPERVPSRLRLSRRFR